MLDMPECDEADMNPQLSCGHRAIKRRWQLAGAGTRPSAFYDVPGPAGAVKAPREYR